MPQEQQQQQQAPLCTTASCTLSAFMCLPAIAPPVCVADAGVTRITTTVSMSILDLIMLDHNHARAM